MKFTYLIIINAIIALAYGISYVVFPVFVLFIYGTTQGPGEVFMARLFGAALIGIGLLLWLARNIADSETQRAINLSMLVFAFIGAVAALHATLIGVMSAVGWTGFAVFSFLALGYAYFWFAKPSTP